MPIQLLIISDQRCLECFEQTYMCICFKSNHLFCTSYFMLERLELFISCTDVADRGYQTFDELNHYIYFPYAVFALNEAITIKDQTQKTEKSSKSYTKIKKNEKSIECRLNQPCSGEHFEMSLEWPQRIQFAL